MLCPKCGYLLDVFDVQCPKCDPPQLPPGAPPPFGPFHETISRIGVIGDIHTEAGSLAAALGFLHAMPLDVLMCTGDIVTGKGDLNRCCQLLQIRGVATVRGNHDRWFLGGAMGDLPDATDEAEVVPEAKLFLASLPPTRTYATAAGPLLLCHGLGEDDMAGVFPHDYGYALEANHRLNALYTAAEYRFIVNGHTHHRMVRAFDSLTIINAGTLRIEHEPCFLTVDFGQGAVQFYDLQPDLAIVQGQAYNSSGERIN